MDARLEGRYPARGAREVAALAHGCLAKHARDRPTMREVVERLRQAMRHTEMDGAVECRDSPPHQEEEAPGTPGTEEDARAVAAAASEAEARATRRMRHLAALGQGFFYRSVPRGIPRLPPLPLGYGNGTER
jgi:hypothetical protein